MRILETAALVLLISRSFVKSISRASVLSCNAWVSSCDSWSCFLRAWISLFSAVEFVPRPWT